MSRGRAYADRLNAIAFSNLTATGSGSQSSTASSVSSIVRVVALMIECLLELIEFEYCLFDGRSAASSTIDAGEQTGLDPPNEVSC